MEHIGIDVHKRESQICILTEGGETEPRRLAEGLGERPCARIVLEASTESEWVARCLEGLGHEVIVADPNFAPMYVTRTRKVKTDRRDARALTEACLLGPTGPRTGCPMRNAMSGRASPSATLWCGPGRGTSPDPCNERGAASGQREGSQARDREAADRRTSARSCQSARERSNWVRSYGAEHQLDVKIFKGAKPGDLRFEPPTKFEFVINLATSLGLPPPPRLCADQIIERGPTSSSGGFGPWSGQPAQSRGNSSSTSPPLGSATLKKNTVRQTARASTRATMAVSQ